MPHGLQRVQVCQQVLNLLLRHDLAETFHLGPAVLDDVCNTLIVRGESANRQILLLENALQSRAFLATRRIGLMTAVAIVVVEFSARGLLRIESEFGIGFAALDITANQREKGKCPKQRIGYTETRTDPVYQVH